MKFDNQDIIYENKNGIEYIRFKKLLEYGIKNAYTLKGDNVNFRGNLEKAKECYGKLFDALDLDIKTLVKPIQKHSSNVMCIDKVIPMNELQNIDGLITDKKQITLASTNADCILFLIYDPVKKVIANVHSGWRGTFQKIIEKTIIKMMNYYRSKPEDIIICISPSIRKCHFEVDEDVKELCEKIFWFIENKDEFIVRGDVKNDVQKYFIDTVMINKILLKELGVKEENIIDCNICSVCSSDKINSYRVEGEGFKLATSVISL